jgi:hypothetical protein
VLDAVGWEPVAVDALLLRTGLSLGELGAVLDRLDETGWIVRRGSWCERVGNRAGERSR